MTLDHRLPWLTVALRRENSPMSSTTSLHVRSLYESDRDLFRCNSESPSMHEQRYSIRSSRPSSGQSIQSSSTPRHYSNSTSASVTPTKRPLSAPPRTGGGFCLATPRLKSARSDGKRPLRRAQSARPTLTGNAHVHTKLERPLLADGTVHPTGSVEYCCITKGAVLHARVPRPKSATSSLLNLANRSKTNGNLFLSRRGRSNEADGSNSFFLVGSEHSETDSDIDNDDMLANGDSLLQPELQVNSEVLDVVMEEQEQATQMDDHSSATSMDLLVEDIEDNIEDNENKLPDESDNTGIFDRQVDDTADQQLVVEDKTKTKLKRMPKAQRKSNAMRRADFQLHRRKWKGVPRPDESEEDESPYKPHSALYRSPLMSSSTMVLSKLSCRFEVPIDWRHLENTSPLEYLSRHSIVCGRRDHWYHKVFRKLNPLGSGLVPLKDVRAALVNIHFRKVSNEHIAKVLEVACVPDDCKLNKKEFYGLAALSERLLCIYHCSNMKRCTLESLDWRLWRSGVKDFNISPELIYLFELINENKGLSL